MVKALTLILLFFFSITVNAQFSTAVQNEFQEVLDTFKSKYNLIGLSVAVQNVNSNWTGTAGISTSTDSINDKHKFAMGSVSKTITSATILQMYEDGLLDLEDSVSGHLGLMAWVTPSITIRQLLNHTSGLFNYTQHPDFTPTVFYNSTAMISTAEIFNKYMKGSSFSPGTSWGYSNTNYVLLGMIVEKISGKKYYKEARDRFGFTAKYPSMSLPPFESSTDSLAHLWIDTIGNGTYFDVQAGPMSTNALFTGAGAAGAYVSTPSDLAQWAYDLYSGGILKNATMLKLFDTVPNSEGYGLGALIHGTDCGQTIYGHNGGIYYRTATFYSKDKDLAVSVHTNDANVSVTLESLAKELFCIYSGPTEIKEIPLIKEPIIYPNPVLDKCIVQFKVDNNTHLEIVNLNGAIVYKEKMEPSSINTSQITLKGLKFPSGIYFLRIKSEYGMKTVKLVKL